LVRVKQKLCSGDYIVPGDQWPILLYKGYVYDAEDPWKGLLRSAILVSVSMIFWLIVMASTQAPSFETFKHIFTSPSSVEKEPKATRSGNARIHGMTKVTLGSIAYVATQVCAAS
jgi:hypothetical protein